MRKILLFISAILTISFVSSCEIETSSDGNLYGFWHLVSIDSMHSDNPEEAVIDYSQRRVFWSVQMNLVHFLDVDSINSPIICRFQREGDSLFFDTPYYLDRVGGDPPVTELNRMQFYGLGSMKPRMKIESLSSNKMQLNTGEVRLKFKKM